MKDRVFVLAAALVLAGMGGAMAQPQTKLVSRLDKPTIQAIWCSALFFERSYYQDADGEQALHYENLAFDLGDRIDQMLRDEHGMRDAEIDEIWMIFDGDAYDLAAHGSDSFVAQVVGCESNFASLL